MSLIIAKNISEFKNFSHIDSKLMIYERNVPKDSANFFKKLIKIDFSVNAEISKFEAKKNIKSVLLDVFPFEIKASIFYETWINDIAHLCKIFSDIQNTNSISMWLGSKRGCKRYHIDNVPQRLLVTYSGEGTEWLPDDAADKIAYLNGEPNEKILKNSKKKQFVNEWDIAIFKGGSEGLLHRTPDSALNKNSILLRLDHAHYWKNVYNNIA